MEKVKKTNNIKNIFPILKGSLIATIVSLIGILFFAFIIKLFGITDNFLRPVNQVIKGASIITGVLVSLKKDSNNGLIKGLIIGLIYTALAFVVFSLLNGKFNVDKTLLTDLIFGGVMGSICGVIAVNLNKKNKNE